MDRRKFFVMLAAGVAGLGMGVKGYAQGGYVAAPKKPFLCGEIGPQPMWPARSPFIVAMGQGNHIGSVGGGGAYQGVMYNRIVTDQGWIVWERASWPS